MLKFENEQFISSPNRLCKLASFYFIIFYYEFRLSFIKFGRNSWKLATEVLLTPQLSLKLLQKFENEQYICIIILGHSDFDSNIFEGNKTKDCKVSRLFVCLFVVSYNFTPIFFAQYVLTYYYLPFNVVCTVRKVCMYVSV